jgi:hypothetical protein
MKVLKSTHKGHDVLLCKGCGCVAEDLTSTEYFPEGYHFDVCPYCHQELDYKDPVVIENKPL